MEMAGSGAIETTEEDLKKEVDGEKKKKINDDIVVFIRKRSGLDAPRLIAKLKSYVNFQHKRRRADAVRKRAEDGRARKKEKPKKKVVYEKKEKPSDVNDHQSKADEQPSRRCRCEKQAYRFGWWSTNNSAELSDCGCRARRRRRSRRARSCCRRRRRRSCRRRRRCRRRRSCRRRRRSRCRRRRRRSCRRRRRSCKRRR